MDLPETERFASKLGKKPFLVTMEVNPPKGTDLSEVRKAVDGVRGLVDAINVTDGSGAIMRACSLAVAKAVLEVGVDPILQMTCRDRNRLALQADLLGAAMFGIRNLLLLTGDDPKAGDHPETKPVFDVNSATLISVSPSIDSPMNVYSPSGKRARNSSRGSSSSGGSALSKAKEVRPCVPTPP